jgi:dihydrofolate reductase
MEYVMRKLIYSMIVSLDGFIEGPNRGLDWPVIDEELHTHANDQQRGIDVSLYGRRMYEVMSYWETADRDPSITEIEREFAHLWKRTPKVVFSTTLEQVEGNARLVRDGAVDEIARLKSQPGKDIDIGGATLAATAIRHDLVDEFRLYLQPVVFGSGTPYLPPLDHPLNLRLVDTRTFRSGVVYLAYQRTDERQEGRTSPGEQ